MTLRLGVFYCLLTLTIYGYLNAEELDVNNDINRPLFISLGVDCTTAMNIRDNGFRTASFPFDWVVSSDGESLVDLIGNHFISFLDKNYLTLIPDGTILNTHYTINFRHNWSSPLIEFDANLLEIQEKYQRRIRRFYNLNHYQGKVYFIRTAVTHVPPFKNNCTILTQEHAEALENILNQTFPDLDFSLIILNYVEDKAPDLTFTDKMIEFKLRRSHTKEDFSIILKFLEAEAFI